MSDYAELVKRLEKSCRYAGTDNKHGSPISACPGACREYSLMTDAADAIKALVSDLAAANAKLAALERENSKLRSALEIVHFKQEPWQ